MNTPCAACEARSGGKTACRHLLDGFLRTFVDAPDRVRRCTACNAGADHVPLCDACYAELEEVHVRVDDAAVRDGYALIDRARYDAAELRPGGPIPRVRAGDFAKLAFASIPSHEQAHIEAMWVRDVVEREDGLEGILDNDPQVVRPLVAGDAVRFRREHVIGAQLQGTLAARTDGHACAECDDAAGPPRVQGEEDRVALRDVRRFGVHIIGVPDGKEEEQLGFVYTLGAHHSFGVPDLIAVGLDFRMMVEVFNRLFRDVEAGRPLRLGEKRTDVFENAAAILLSLDDTPAVRERMTWTRWFHKGPSPCAQLVWSDPWGAFPWEPHATSTRQDVLAAPVAFH